MIAKPTQIPSVNFNNIIYTSDINMPFNVVKVPKDPRFVLAYMPIEVYQDVMDTSIKDTLHYHRNQYLISQRKGTQFVPHGIKNQPIDGTKFLVINEDLISVCSNLKDKQYIKLSQEQYDNEIYKPVGERTDPIPTVLSNSQPTPPVTFLGIPPGIPQSTFLGIPKVTSPPKVAGLSFKCNASSNVGSTASTNSIVFTPTTVTSFVPPLLPPLTNIFDPSKLSNTSENLSLKSFSTDSLNSLEYSSHNSLNSSSSNSLDD